MKFFSLFDKLVEENRILKLVVLSLTALNFVLALMYIRATNKVKVVVVPPEIRKEFWMVGNEVSREYLEQVFYYVTSSLLNVSPETVDESLSRIYVFLTTDPDLLEKIRLAFREYALAVKKNKVYQSFYPMTMEVKGNTVIVKGILRKTVGVGSVKEESREVKYKFTVRNSRLFIEGIEL